VAQNRRPIATCVVRMHKGTCWQGNHVPAALEVPIFAVAKKERKKGNARVFIALLQQVTRTAQVALLFVST